MTQEPPSILTSKVDEQVPDDGAETGDPNAEFGKVESGQLAAPLGIDIAQFGVNFSDIPAPALGHENLSLDATVALASSSTTSQSEAKFCRIFGG